MDYWLVRPCLCALVSSLGMAVSAAAEKVDIYCLAFSHTNEADAAIAKTIEKVDKTFGNYSFQTHFVNTDELQRKFEDCPKCFFVSSSGDFYKKQFEGAWRLATLTTFNAPDPNQGEAGAIIVKRHSGIKKLDDLKNKTVAVTHKNAFLNSQLVLAEVVDQGKNPDGYFREIKEQGRPMRGLLESVEAGRAHAAFVRAGLLEGLKKRGDPLADNLEVIEQKNDDALKYLHSTKPVPGWTFFAGRDVNPEVATDLTVELLSIKPKDLEGAQWFLGTDYTRVDTVFRNVKAGPYEHLKFWSLKRFWDEYKLFIVLAIALFVFSIFHNWRNTVLVQKRTRELAIALDEQQKLLNRVRGLNVKLAEMQKLSAVGVLSSITTHELLQPLAASRYLTTALQDILKTDPQSKLYKLVERLDKSVAKSVALVEKVRSYVRRKEHNKQYMDVVETTKTIIHDLIDTKVIATTPIFTYPGEVPRILFDPFDFEVVVLNLLKNANDELEKSGKIKVPIQISISSQAGAVELKVENEGREISAEEIETLRQPFKSTKEKGLGLGMSIVSLLMQAQALKAKFLPRQGGGMIAILVFNTEESDKAIRN